MAFDDFLVHKCSINIPGEKPTGKEDVWGNPITTGDETFNEVACRFIKKATNTLASDGKSRIYEMTLLLGPKQTVSEDMTVSNIVDKNGSILHVGKLKVQEILMRNGFSEIHNRKIILKGSG